MQIYPPYRGKTDEKSRIRIPDPLVSIRIRGSGSLPKYHGSITLPVSPPRQGMVLTARRLLSQCTKSPRVRRRKAIQFRSSCPFCVCCCRLKYEHHRNLLYERTWSRQGLSYRIFRPIKICRWWESTSQRRPPQRCPAMAGLSLVRMHCPAGSGQGAPFVFVFVRERGKCERFAFRFESPPPKKN